MKLLFALGLAGALALSSPAQTLYRGPGDPTPPLGGYPGSPYPYGTPDLTTWPFWWEFNRTPYLRELFQERQTPAAPGVTPTKQDLARNVGPTLLRQLGSNPPPELIAATLIALAKLGGENAEPALVPLFRRYLDDGRPQVASSAALALGILGDGTALPVLVELVADTPAGRKQADAIEVPTRVRVFAAAALGTLARQTDDNATRRTIRRQLRATFEADSSPTRDVQVACLLALGLVPIGEPEARHEAVAWLFGVLEDSAGSGAVRCHAAGTISCILACSEDNKATEAALEVLLRLAMDPREKREVNQSCLLALGRLADTDPEGIDGRVRAAVINFRRTCTDTQVRNFSLVALAEIGGRAGPGDPAKAIAEISAHLELTMQKGRSAMRPWAAIGAGLLAHQLGEATPPELIEVLRTKCAAERTPRVAPYALGMGLSARRELAPLLLESYGRFDDEETRGAIGLALGLLQAGEPTLLASFVAGRDQPRLQQDLAVALALIGSDKARNALLDELARAGTPDLKGALAFAIGNLHDRRTIAPLIKLVSDTKLPATTRAAAAAALGILGARQAIPWHEPLTRGFNHRASTYALTGCEPPGLFLVL